MLLTDSPEIVAKTQTSGPTHPTPRTPMQKRIAAGLLALAVGLAGWPARAAPPAQPTTDKATPPKLVYGHDLPVRPAGTVDVSAKTPRYGVDVFQDETTQATIAISQVGAISVTPTE